jgi:hypothetical protein
MTPKIVDLLVTQATMPAPMANISELSTVFT